MIRKTNSPLKMGLIGNALFSLLTGISLLIGAEPIAKWIGVPDPRILAAIGLILIPFAVHLWMAARRTPIQPGEIYYLSTLDAFWVIGSGMLLLSGWVPFTMAGAWTVAVVALAVADFMMLQLIGVLRLNRVAAGNL